MNETIDMVTTEEVARSYRAALDSCDLLAAGKPVEMTEQDWLDCKARNIEHLNIQLAKPDFYQGYDLTPFEEAILL